MTDIVISGSGLFTPRQSISNAELVDSFNSYVDLYNTEHAGAIAAGEFPALEHSSVAFIEKASGIKNRYVVNKDGVLDPARMAPRISERSNDEPSVMCEIGTCAAQQAMTAAAKTAADVDAVLVAASNMQRPYPAMAVELQNALGVDGWGYDMNVACSSATFGIQAAHDAIAAGSAHCVLVVNPEICSGHLNFRDRDAHFIFGDVCTAVVVEHRDTATSSTQFEILSTRLKTRFSNNIRNNFGFLNRADESGIGKPDKLFRQNGRKVFKEVCPMVAELILEHLASQQLESSELRRLWLHQANLSMNQLIGKRVLGREATADNAPTILDEYANTSSAGSVIAFHKHHADFQTGDIGLLCSFGAGYSIGSVILRKL